MPRILASHAHFPSPAVPQQQVKAAVETLYADELDTLAKPLGVFDNARIATRHLIMPLDWYRHAAAVSERNRIYQQRGSELLLEACRNCLEDGGLTPEQVNHVIFVSSTGHATPSLDAGLIGGLGLPRTTTRLPVWGLGCAAGAAGLARACDYCRAYPDARVLVAALECCSLNFLRGNVSRKNLIATALFSDGAAAVLVGGDDVPGDGPRILATRSDLLPDSGHVMGWEFRDEGMELVLSPRLPTLIRRGLADQVDAFLACHGLRRVDLAHYLVHPGGAKILDACRAALDLTGAELALSEQELRQHGNTSSVSVLAVLSAWLAGGCAPAGYGLLAGFGPGFSTELLLLRS